MDQGVEPLTCPKHQGRCQWKSPALPTLCHPFSFLKLLCSQPSAEPRGVSHMDGSCQKKSDSCMGQHRQDGVVPLLQSPPHCQVVNADREEVAHSISFQHNLDIYINFSPPF